MDGEDELRRGQCELQQQAEQHGVGSHEAAIRFRQGREEAAKSNSNRYGILVVYAIFGILQQILSSNSCAIWFSKIANVLSLEFRSA
jgi:hypothetical protein